MANVSRKAGKEKDTPSDNVMGLFLCKRRVPVVQPGGWDLRLLTCNIAIGANIESGSGQAHQLVYWTDIKKSPNGILIQPAQRDQVPLRDYVGWPSFVGAVTQIITNSLDRRWPLGPDNDPSSWPHLQADRPVKAIARAG